MRASRILALSSLAFLLCVFLAACGGGSGTKPTPAGPPTITSTVLTQATVNVPYSFYLEASGGTGTYTWSISSGSLPPGLTFSDSTAEISGTVPEQTNGVPTRLGNYLFTAKVTDQNNLSGTANLTLVVGGALLIDCNSCIGTQRLPTGSPGVPYNATLSVSGGVTPYTWCVLNSGGTACDPTQSELPPGLTLTTDSQGNGIISGTPTSVPAVPTQFTVQVTDSELPVASATEPLTLTIMGILTTSLPTATLNSFYSQQLTGSGGVAAYTWCVMETSGACDNGSGGALPTGLTLAPSCVDTRLPSCTISGTPTVPGSYPFTVQLKDGETPPAVVTSQLTITVPGITNALLNGNYAFSLNGYQNGTPFIMAAAFVADGNGNITGGFLDLNNGSGEQIDSHGNVTPQIISPGSAYNLNPNGTGTVTIMTSLPATYQFSVVVSPNACVAGPNISTCGTLIESDPSNPQTYGSGALKVQNMPDFQITAFFPGDFALLAIGTDPSGNRYAGAGAVGTNPSTLVDIDCSGNGWGLANGCPLDIDDNGQVPSGGDPFKGSFSSTLDPTTGRGNYVDISFPTDPNGLCLGTVSSPACHYAYYVIDHSEMIIISADPLSKPANLTLWRAYRQTSSAGGWTLTALTASSSSSPACCVMELNGVDPNGGSPLADVTAGFLVSNGAGSATLNTDENDGGTMNLQQSSPGMYAIDTEGQKTGRVTFSGFTTQFGTTPPVLYLFGSDSAFVVGTDAKVTSGVLEPQKGSPFSNSSVADIYAGGTISPVLTAVTNSVTDLIANGAGGITAAQYTSGPGGPTGPNNLMLTYSVDDTGRAVVTQNGNQYGILYVVSPTKFVLLPVGTAPVLSVFASAPGF